MSTAPPPYPGTEGQYPPPGGQYPPPSQGPPYPAGEKGGPPPQQQPGAYPQAQPAGYPQGQPGGYPTQAQPQPGAYPPGSAPPPAQYAQPGQPGYSQQTVVVTQPMVATTVVQHYRESPIQTTCPHCHAQVVTAVHYETGTLTWLICVILCLVGCNLGCCFIPFCIDGCKDVMHTCPNCRQMISRWSRM